MPTDKNLDMSLDDIIKSRNISRRTRGRGGGRQGLGGARQGLVVRGSFNRGRMAPSGTFRQGPLRVNTRPSAFTIAKSFSRSKNFPWKHDLFEESLAAAGLPGTENSTKLFISNLDKGVSNDDIRELFSEIGELKRYAIHFDNNGRPSGSAEVIYARRSDAFAAVKRYNNVQLDGRPMKIEILSSTSEVPVSARVNVIGGTRGRTTRRVVELGRGSSRSLAPMTRGAGRGVRGGLRGSRGLPWPTPRGGFRNGTTRGRGQGQGKKKNKSAEELDNELDKYHAEAMQTS